MIQRKIIITTLLFSLGISTAVMADNTDLITQCSAALNLSDDQFSAQAATLSSLLDNCQVNNICSQINNIDNCSNLLSSRDFLSNYLAMKPADSDSVSAQAPVLPAAAPTVSATNNSTPATAPTTAPNSASSGAANNGTTNSGNKQDIHWF